jgi:serine/threonine protein kinase
VPARDTARQPVDDTRATWDLLAGRLDAFLRAWEGGAPPELAAFVPDVPPPLRRLILAELVKADLDQRLRRGMPARLEDYLAALPDLAAGGAPCDLIFEEYQLRRRAGEAVTPDDYFRRFPGQAAELARLLDVTAPAPTTALFRPEAARPLQAGDRLDDFDLLTQLGRGAFAQVFLARQRSMQRLVALKVSADRGAEATTLAQLDHPHVVRVYDVRVLGDRGLQLLYMKYLPGGTLDDVLGHVRDLTPGRRDGRAYLAAVDAVLERRGESPPAGSALRGRLAGLGWPAVVCWVGARLAQALDYAHRQGVLHRDIKPANVLLTAEGSPCLADFNVGCCSKLDGAGPAALFGGSLAYMSPEQIEALDPHHPRSPDSVDGRSDVFALGVTLWELLTGARPFAGEELRPDWGETLAALAERRRAGLPPGADAALPPGCPPGLSEVLHTCLAEDPDRRYATAGELAVALELCLRPRLAPAARGWRAWARRHPVLTLLPLGAVPNVVASLFNIAYNRGAIIDRLAETVNPAYADAFRELILAINGVFFPAGLGLFAALAWPAVRALGRREAGEWLAPEEAARARRLCLRLGEIVAYICVGAWLVAGVLWPLSLDVTVGRMPARDHLHLLASLALCGLIAAAYPFFLVTAAAVRLFYPALLLAGPPDAADGPALARLGGLLGRFLVMAAAVPLLGIALLALGGVSDSWPLSILSLSGLAGLVLAYRLERATRADLEALAQVAAPPDAGGLPPPAGPVSGAGPG